MFEKSVAAVVLKDRSGVVVVEFAKDKAPDNAIILNPDGSLRKRIRNPDQDQGAIAYGDVFYVGDELTLVNCFPSEQRACVIDRDGNVLRSYETR